MLVRLAKGRVGVHVEVWRTKKKHAEMFKGTVLHAALTAASCGASRVLLGDSRFTAVNAAEATTGKTALHLAATVAGHGKTCALILADPRFTKIAAADAVAGLAAGARGVKLMRISKLYQFQWLTLKEIFEKFMCYFFPHRR